jgi:ketosteroid isomerase-like protein
MPDMVDRAAFEAWIAGYERAWRTPGTDALSELFADDATYLHSPYEDPITGLADIARDWDGERDGPDEAFTMESEVIAVDGDTAVARVLVRYGDPVRQEYLDLWIVRFAADGRCTAFEEWPFWPDQPWNASGA